MDKGIAHELIARLTKVQLHTNEVNVLLVEIENKIGKLIQIEKAAEKVMDNASAAQLLGERNDDVAFCVWVDKALWEDLRQKLEGLNEPR